jgi:hypothetical protein
MSKNLERTSSREIPATNTIEGILQDIHSQRVTSLKSQIEYIQEQIHTRMIAYNIAKDGICKNFDNTYVTQVEYDEIFMRGKGEEFEIQYLQHRFFVVRKWAELRKTLVELQIQHGELVNELYQIEQDSRDMYKTPVELYRNVLSLQDELYVTKNELQKTKTDLSNVMEIQKQTNLELFHVREEQNRTRMELMHNKEEQKYMKMELFQMIERMTELIIQQQNKTKEILTHKEYDQKCLLFSIVDPGISINNDAVLLRSGSDCGHTEKVIGGQVFPNDRPFVFFMKILFIPSNWIIFGITSNLAMKYPYFNEKTFYGWNCNASVFKAGDIIVGEDDWPGWEQGDESIIRYNPSEHSFQLFHRRLGRMFQITDIPNIPFYITVIFLYGQSCVQIRNVLEDEISESMWCTTTRK